MLWYINYVTNEAASPASVSAPLHLHVSLVAELDGST